MEVLHLQFIQQETHSQIDQQSQMSSSSPTHSKVENYFVSLWKIQDSSARNDKHLERMDSNNCSDWKTVAQCVSCMHLQCVLSL
jgi:hypothetical protein